MKKFKLIGVVNHNELQLKEVKTGEVITSSPDELEVIDNEFFALRKEKRTKFIADAFTVLFCYVAASIIIAILIFSGII